MNGRFFLLFAVAVILIPGARIEAAADVWGQPPPASDDRFTNPDKPLYAGPEGWWNTGEVRAAGAADLAFKGGFTTNSDLFIATSPSPGLQVFSMDFGSGKLPAPGDYAIGAKGDVAAKTVRFSLSDLAGGVIKEWSSGKDAGTLTVKLVHGFTFFTCREVKLAPAAANEGKFAAPMVAGFEGALAPE